MSDLPISTSQELILQVCTTTSQVVLIFSSQQSGYKSHSRLGNVGIIVELMFSFLLELSA